MPRSRQRQDGGEEGFDLEELLEEVRGIRAERDELRQAVEELRAASTPQQRRRAERDVREAETGLAKALRAEGFSDISVEDLEDIRLRKRRAEYDAWLDERMERMGAELDAEADAARGEGDGKTKSKRTRAKTKADADDDPDEGHENGAGDGEESRRRSYF